ncbi:MAG TPA: (2Fe-2S)-binding protein [Candidatus Acidoferrales bacterium]|jgi:xanthine dehydrogenase YagT iron-sulfur-binding subunit|nr:(2Fe-2S)-binding protein [Candidatus Acidoferrales bacterium]
MAKRPGTEPPEEEILKKNNGRDDAERVALGRREFVKLAGTASVAVGVLAGGDLLKAEPTPQEAPDAATSKLVGPGPVKMLLKINGKHQVLVAEPRVTLLDALRDHIYLTGAKKVCDRGTCGACTVIINGAAMYSCSVLAIDVAERPGQLVASIETIESLAPAGQLHPVSAAFVDNDASQCGFCTPGFVMSAKAYIDKHPHPTYEQVKASLGGNLCRCGTYMGVRHAVVEAAGKMASGRGGNA